MQDAIWVLPKTKRTQEQFQWLAAEIKEIKGESTLWETQALFTADGTSLRQQFIDAVDREYDEIIAALKSKDRDLAMLSKRFQDIQTKDHFASPLGKKTREKLLSAGGE